MKKLEIGKKYNITIKDTTYAGLFYIGVCDSLCWVNCEFCGKEIDNGYVFMKPSKNETFENCIDGKFEYQIEIGSHCIKKVKITEV